MDNQKMNKIIELLKDHDFVSNLEKVKSEDELKKLFSSKDIDITVSDFGECIEKLLKLSSGEILLSESELKSIVGGESEDFDFGILQSITTNLIQIGFRIKDITDINKKTKFLNSWYNSRYGQKN